MIRRLRAKNFTVFRDLDLEFASGVTTVIGANGAGKSHLLKLAYVATKWSGDCARLDAAGNRPDKATCQRSLGAKLTGVLRPDSLGRLSSRGVGVRRTEVDVHFGRKSERLQFGFSTRSEKDAIIESVPSEFWDGESIFVPTKEMLTLFPGFKDLYETYKVEIDETYYDLAKSLDRAQRRGRKLKEARAILDHIDEAIDGTVRLENGRFYLSRKKAGDFEIALVAEGFRKLAMIQHLLGTDAMAEQSILFWDEPETNLNPRLLSTLARVLCMLAQQGMQIVLATHSLHLVRELSLLLEDGRFEAVDRKFVALGLQDDGGVAVSTGRTAEEVQPIVALDAEIEQSERYLERARAGLGS